MTNESRRINKFLADAGCCSRRQADELIKNGKVKINGKVAKLGDTVEANDQIELDGQTVTINNDFEYYLLSKPKGYICSSKDELGRKHCVDLVKSEKRLFTVGRLDKDSEGLIILTNDGYFAEGMIHPSKKIEKIYELSLTGKEVDRVVECFMKGIKIDHVEMRADKVEIVRINSESGIFHVTLHQGYNRQLRKMSASLRLDVKSLKRIAIGKLRIGDLKPGEYRKLDPKEVNG